MESTGLVLKLDLFEGPLDLLLHLIRSQKLDVRDIPIALVTEQYLAGLELMKELDVDVAGEWLVMAATLLHIKSKTLLPAESAAGEEENQEDPRADLARRLLEYERYKEAAAALGARDLLSRDVFARTFPAPDLDDPVVAETGPRPFEPVSVFDLLSAFARALASRPPTSVHEVTMERVSLADKIADVLDRLAARESLPFEELFPAAATRADVVVSFLAVLELIRLRVIRAYQAGPFGPIRLFAAFLPSDAEAANRASDPPLPDSRAAVLSPPLRGGEPGSAASPPAPVEGPGAAPPVPAPVAGPSGSAEES